jgi:hypothetical protein
MGMDKLEEASKLVVLIPADKWKFHTHKLNETSELMVFKPDLVESGFNWRLYNESIGFKGI